MPVEVHGLKFDEMTGTTAVIEFDSDRMPVWHDFYAKDGDTWAAWNVGIDLPDPLDPPSDDSINNHILAPNSVIPEPGMLLFMSAAGAMGLFRRRR